ncbi:hypothetical protein ASF69_01540 [Rhizobium sp. Leaf311]|uniref:hypothetical protein n=1 Tax=Rhizobium sp. Leaf311 TaxID=1736332 RepID=UPI000714A3B5|nr:hypothetical protein [Rhizobium sp. Leaf311]KQQ61133.1 hypothetical protein ASF69_01540 [Rhizobium sp. Leaf311]
MKKYGINEYGIVEIVGTGPLSDQFLIVRMESVARKLNSIPDEYMIWADTKRYRRDRQAHPLDVQVAGSLANLARICEERGWSLTVNVSFPDVKG